MGILKFAAVGNYKGFYEKLKEISKKNGKSPKLMFMDTAISYNNKTHANWIINIGIK